MDHLDQLGAKAFDGFLVRKDLVRKYSRLYPAPTYLVEFLLGRYCASTDPAGIEEGLQIVEKQLQGRTVRSMKPEKRQRQSLTSYSSNFKEQSTASPAATATRPAIGSSP